MKKRFLLFAIPLFLNLDVRAQEAAIPPREACLGYMGSSPVSLELAWAAGCLLQAIYEKNKTLIADLAEGARCTDQDSCDGPLDKLTSEFIFGSKLSPEKSLHKMISKADSVIMAFDYAGDEVEVMFMPRPGKETDTLSNGWMNSFFACRFNFDSAQMAWNVGKHGFCYSESDVFTGGDESHGAVLDRTAVDLTGGNSDLPIVIWKPRRSK